MIQIKSFGNATSQQKNDALFALQQANSAISSSQFAQLVLNAKFSCTTDTNEQVLQKLTSSTANVSLTFYTLSWWQKLKQKITTWTVDANESGSGQVSVNADAWTAMTAADKAALLAHESCHALGYTHPYLECADRDNSVPYQIEKFVQQIIL